MIWDTKRTSKLLKVALTASTLIHNLIRLSYLPLDVQTPPPPILDAHRLLAHSLCKEERIPGYCATFSRKGLRDLTHGWAILTHTSHA
jgi:hypothetical protein